MAAKKATEPENKALNAGVDNSPDTDGKAGNEANTEATEPVYTAAEFAKAAGTVFCKPYSPDIVRAAFAYAGKTTATKAEAEKIVKEFANKEVQR